MEEGTASNTDGSDGSQSPVDPRQGVSRSMRASILANMSRMMEGFAAGRIRTQTTRRTGVLLSSHRDKPSMIAGSSSSPISPRVGPPTSLESHLSDFSAAYRWASLPTLPLEPLDDCCHVLALEAEESNEGLIVGLPGVCAGRSTSTYPLDQFDQRYAEPICDHFGARLYGNRHILVLADGCGWGRKNRVAAEKGTEGFISYVQRHAEQTDDVMSTGRILLEAMAEAQRFIVRGHAEKGKCGTSTLAGALLVPLQGVGPKRKWAFVVASVGDCKAYCYRKASGTVVDVTAGNRVGSEPTDARDPGGRLGPYVDGKWADLRNLSVTWIECHAGDLVWLVSDGVHDNMDAQAWGIPLADMLAESIASGSPSAHHGDAHRALDDDGTDSSTSLTCSPRIHSSMPRLPSHVSPKLSAAERSSAPPSHAPTPLSCSTSPSGSSPDSTSPRTASSGRTVSWSNVSDHMLASLKEHFACALAADVITAGDTTLPPVTPELLVDRVVDHCLDATYDSRTWMWKNSGKLPSDYAQFPGKIDHTTCLCMLVDEVAPAHLPLDHDALRRTIGALDAAHGPSALVELCPPLAFQDTLTLGNNPIAVTLGQTGGHLFVWVQALSGSDVACVPSERSITLSMTLGEASVAAMKRYLSDDNSVLTMNEVVSSVQRVLPLPSGVCLNPDSMHRMDKRTDGIVTFRFDKIALSDGEDEVVDDGSGDVGDEGVHGNGGTSAEG